MDISAEREEIIRRFKLVKDMDLINAIKKLLDFGLQKQSEDNQELHASIDRAINESEKGLVRPYEEVMADLRKRYASLP